MKPIRPRQDTIGNRISRTLDTLTHGDARMACPCCATPMTPRLTDAELHTDPTGYGVFQCQNPECHIQPRYRRADIEGFFGATPAQQEQAAMIQAGELEMGRRANEELNEITRWLRDSRWKHLLDGRYSRLSDLVTAILDAEQWNVPAMAPKEGPR